VARASQTQKNFELGGMAMPPSSKVFGAAFFKNLLLS
jgi:hypothetical protein